MPRIAEKTADKVVIGGKKCKKRNNAPMTVMRWDGICTLMVETSAGELVTGLLWM